MKQRLRKILRSPKRLAIAAVATIAAIVVLQAWTDQGGDEYRPPRETLEALKLGHEGKYEQAFELFLEQAQQGDRFAQAAVGSMYGRGEGVSRNREKAIEWYKEAAEQGQSSAQYNLGKVYLGESKYRDVEKAIDWFRKSASAKDPGAANELGLAFERGTGFEVDERKALEWYRDAAAFGSVHGVTNAARLLGNVDAPWASSAERYKWLVVLDAIDGTEGAAARRQSLEQSQPLWTLARGWLAAHWWMFWRGDKVKKLKDLGDDE